LSSSAAIPLARWRESSGSWLALCSASLFCLLAQTGVAKPVHEPMPPAVRIEMTDEMGEVFADAKGNTLYTWQGDNKAGQSLCNGDKYTEVTGAAEIHYQLPDAQRRPSCQEMWPPFTAAADSTPVGHWTTIARHDGRKQWAYDGKPLYTFANDPVPGSINGIGVDLGRLTGQRAPLWVRMNAPPGVIARSGELGRVLITDKGRTLYALAGEKARKFKCVDECLEQWTPLSAASAATIDRNSDWSIVSRPDSSQQWAYKGRPLYTYDGDTRFGEINGIDEPDWQAVIVQPALAPPKGMTVQMTADGPVFANADGRTMYTWNCSEEAPDRLYCDVPSASSAYWRSLCGTGDQCLSTWRPVVAPKNARAVGRTWTIVTIDPKATTQFSSSAQEGLRVWAYRGKPLYTFAGDKRPADMNGHNVRAFVSWGFGMLRTDGRGGFNL
jgi:predicted lipoprotein with Yx(FWY)xxD motif